MTNPALTFRIARAEDEVALRALTEAAYAPWVPIIGRRPAPMDDPLAPRILRGEAAMSESADGAVQALAIAWPETSVLVPAVKARGPFLYLWNLAVAPDAQGLGLGAAALRHCLERAERLSLDAVELDAHEKMEANLRYYARHGFAEVDRYVSETGFARVRMRKPF